MAAKKVTPDTLSDAIAEILKEYGDEVDRNVNEVTKKIGSAGKAALKSASEVFGGTGKYKKGWSVKNIKDHGIATATIYNKISGLPHLLEYGHAKRGGGRVPGREHIAPVEQTLVKEYEEAIKKAIE